jgi:hypothetical protein
MSDQPPTDNKRIYGTVWELCPRSLRLAAPWRFQAPESCRAVIRNGPEALAVLRRQFSEQALITAGVLERTTAGELLLSTGLCDEYGAVIALRRTLDGPPFDLLTRAGMLSGSCAALAALQDAATVRAMRGEHVLFATAAVEDAAILRIFGLATTTVAGLTRPSLRRQRRLAQVFGDEPATPEPRPSLTGTGGAAVADQTTLPPDRLAEPANRVQLVLVGWSPQYLSADVPGQISEIAQHLGRVRQHLGINVSRVSVWRLSADCLEALKVQARYHALDQLAKSLRTSAKTVYELEKFEDAQGPFPPEDRGLANNVAGARAALENELEQHRHERRTAALYDSQQLYEDRLNAELIDPLRQSALEEHDPVLRSAEFMLADLGALVHLQVPQLIELQKSCFQQGLGPGGDENLNLTLKQASTMFGRYESLVRFVAAQREKHRRETGS